HSHSLRLAARVLRPFSLFFFNAPATSEIYTLSLHDALPICASSSTSWACASSPACRPLAAARCATCCWTAGRSSGSSMRTGCGRSEEHTSELQSLTNLVCRLLLEKKKKQYCKILAGYSVSES